MHKVLITGGSGMIGSQLSLELVRKGYIVHILSRKPLPPTASIRYFKWDLENKIIDEEAFNGISAIIHLAGENIGLSRWTARQKERIISSRAGSIKLIYEKLKTISTQKLRVIISSGAVGFYGDRGDELLTEESEMGTGFLSSSCQQWEAAVNDHPFECRTVIFRCGVVLNRNEGALPQVAKPITLGVGSALGSGKQWMPWVHQNDAVSAYVFALENENLHGTYNLVAPELVRNYHFTKVLAAELNKTLWAPHVPAFLLKAILGERVHLLLDSDRVSSAKIQEEGFVFAYPDLKEALKAIFKK